MPVIDHRFERQIVRRLNFTQRAIIVLFVFLLGVPFLLNWIYGRDLTISNARIVGETVLCPGDNLIITYDFYVEGDGVLVFDSTLWRTSPAATLIYSEWRRFIVPGTISQKVREAWPVPETYWDYTTGEQLPLPPGKYTRLFSVTSPSRSTVSDIGEVEFTVKEC